MRQVVRRGEGRRFSRCRGVVRVTSRPSLPLSCALRGILLSRSRDAAKEPRFGAELGVVDLQRLLDGNGDDPAVSLVQEAFDHLLDAASRIGRGIGPKSRLRALSTPLLFGPEAPAARARRILDTSERKAGSGD